MHGKVEVQSGIPLIWNILSRPHLYNVALAHINRNAKIEAPTSKFQQEGPKLLLAFADNVDLIGSSRIKIKPTKIRFEKVTRKMGVINEENTCSWAKMVETDTE